MEREYKILICPYCECEIWIYRDEIACGIYRHGVYKMNGEQINPHMGKMECDRLYERGEIYGCGKPFRVVIVDSEMRIEECGYI